MKRILMVMLALVIAIVPLSGCKKSGDDVSVFSVWVDDEGNPVVDDSDNNDEDTDVDDGNEDGDGDFVDDDDDDNNDADNDADNNDADNDDDNNDNNDADKDSSKTTSSKKTSSKTTSSKKTSSKTTSSKTTSSKKTSSKTTSSKTISSKKNPSKVTSSKNQGTASSVDGKYDFGGKTFLMGITDEEQYNTTSFKQMVKAFQKKYNLKIKTKKLVFNDYNKQVRNAMTGKEPLDICYIHGSMFPDCVIGGKVIYEDLTAAVNKVDSEVINTKRSKDLFSWDGKLYGVVADNSCFVHLMYYNKYKFQSAGLEDPRELYEKGQWTWDKIFEQGKQVTKGGEVFFGAQNEVVNLYGENGYYLKDGKFYNNLRSPKIRKGLELMRKIYVGNDAIGSTDTGSQSYIEGFKNGLFYIMIEEHSKYPSFAAAAAKSALCGKNKDNAGIVPIPLPAENTSKSYPTGWYTAIACGKGSDPMATVLWTDFSKAYESPVKSKYELTGDNLALVEKLQAGNTNPVRHGQANNSTTGTGETWTTIIGQTKNGSDISQLIEKYYPVFNDCVVTTCGKDRLVEVK